MTTKRQIDQDPDYESIPAGVCPEQKRLRRIEQDARENTIKKIEKILRSQFGHERKNKHEEVHTIDERVEEVRLKLDRLRALVVMKQYSTSKDQPVNSPPSIHPTTKNFLGKAPACHHSQDKFTHNFLPETTVPTFPEIKDTKFLCSTSELNNVKTSTTYIRNSPEKNNNSRTSRFKTKLSIVIGNISKYIPADNRDKDDQATHKWMVYVRGSRDNPHIDHAIKKVRFFLHSSYRPNDLVEVCYPPFHLSRRGWGEFPVRVQLHFHNHLNKPVDIIHNLKLDKTYTGLQTLGAETAVDLWLYMKEAKQKTIPVHSEEVTYSHVENSTSTKTIPVNTCHNNILSNSKVLDIDVSKMKVINRSNGMCTNDIAHRLGKIKTEPALSESVEQNTTNSCENKSLKNTNKAKSVVVIVQQGVKKEAIKQIFPHSCIEKKLIESSLEKQPSAVPLQPHLSQLSHALSPSSSLIQGESSVDKNCVTVCTDKTVKQGDSKLSTHNSLNGLTTFVKCVDGQGRLLLVPQSTVVKFPNTSSVKHERSGMHNSPQTNLSHIPLSIHSSKQSAEIQKTNLPLQKGQKSYVVKVIPNHTGNLNQVILIPTNSANKEKEVSLKFSCSSNLQSSNCKTTGSNKLLDKAAAIEHLMSMKNSVKEMKRDDTDSLNKKLSSIRLEHYDTIHELTNQVAKLFPLIKKDVDRSCHPYCAPTADVFFSWNVGKQRAAEWQRAKGVRQAILKLLQEKSSSFSAKDVWSTKTIMVWCYKTGYTLRKDSLNCKPVTSADDVPSGTHHFGVLKDVSTISEADPILETLEEQQSMHYVEDTEEEIDLVSVENDHASIASKRTIKETQLSKNPTHNSSSVWIPESPCVEFVRDAASQIGIKFQPCELATNVFGHVIEEMILAVCREYITDLLRASLFEGFERTGGSRHPEVIQAEDIFTAIQKLPLYDLLTNKYIGTPPIIERKEVSNSQLK